MARHKITTIPLFRNLTVGTGGTCLSDPIDLRDISRIGKFSISYRVGPAGGVATAGTATVTYLGSPVFDGIYVAESGTSGTSLNSATGGTGIWAFSPFVTPFMKIRGIMGTSGTAIISAELNVQ